MATTDDFFKKEQAKGGGGESVPFDQFASQIPQDQELPYPYIWRDTPNGKVPARDYQAELEKVMDQGIDATIAWQKKIASAPYGDPRGYIASLKSAGIDTGPLKITDDPTYSPMSDNGAAAMQDMKANADPFAANDWNKEAVSEAQRIRAGAETRTDPQSAQITLGRSDDQYAKAALGDAAWMESAQLSPAERMKSVDAQQVDIERADQQFRNAQAGLATQLGESAAGRGPSLGGIALGQGNAAGTAARMSAAASERGYGNSASSRRALAYAQGAQNNNTNIEAAKMRNLEQQQAQASLGSVLGTARSQDIGVATSQAQLDQGVNLQNAQAQTAARAANQAAGNQFALQQGTFNQEANSANQQATNDMIRMNTGNQQQVNIGNAQWNQNASTTQAQLDQNTAQMNLEAQLRARGMNDQQIAQMLQMQSQLGNMDQQNAIDYEKYRQSVDQYKLGTQLGIGQESYNRQQAANAKSDAFMGTVLGVVGGAAGSFLGPLGTAAGSYLGSKIGGAVSNSGSSYPTTTYNDGGQQRTIRSSI